MKINQKWIAERARPPLVSGSFSTFGTHRPRTRTRISRHVRNTHRHKPASQSRGGEEYDPTPLAAIGILGEIKTQSNVAGWIRTGGLWGPPQPSLRPSLSHSHPLHLRPLSGNDASIDLLVTRNQDRATATDGEGNAEGEGETDVVRPRADPAILGSEREKCAG